MSFCPLIARLLYGASVFFAGNDVTMATSDRLIRDMLTDLESLFHAP